MSPQYLPLLLLLLLPLTSLKAVSPRYICVARYWTHFYVDPAESFHYRWLFFVSMAVLYNVVFIIVRAVFTELQTTYVTLWLVLDYVCDFVYVLDMGIQFRTGPSVGSGSVLRAGLIKRHSVVRERCTLRACLLE